MCRKEIIFKLAEGDYDSFNPYPRVAPTTGHLISNHGFSVRLITYYYYFLKIIINFIATISILILCYKILL